MPDDTGSTSNLAAIISAIGGLLGGGLQTYGAMQQQSEYNDAIRQAQARERQLQDYFAKQTPGDIMSAAIGVKQQLNAQVRFAIIQEITAGMASRGLSGSTGIVQEAIAEALAKAELPLWQMAIQTVQQQRSDYLKSGSLQPTIPRPPGPNANPFGSLINLAFNKKLLGAIFPDKKESPSVDFGVSGLGSGSSTPEGAIVSSSENANDYDSSLLTHD